jgi:hypothetical protein
VISLLRVQPAIKAPKTINTITAYVIFLIVISY